jgi:sec-independent protein translocase protein TatA
MVMFGRWIDFLPIVLLALLFFGPKRLPEIGSSVGKTIKEFQKGMKEVTEPKNEAPAAPPANQTPALPAGTTETTALQTTPTPAETKAE